MHVLRFKNKANQIFTEYYLNGISLRPYVSGRAQPKLNQQMLNSIVVPLPELSTQKSIVAKLEAFLMENKKQHLLWLMRNTRTSEIQHNIGAEYRGERTISGACIAFQK